MIAVSDGNGGKRPSKEQATHLGGVLIGIVGVLKTLDLDGGFIAAIEKAAESPELLIFLLMAWRSLAGFFNRRNRGEAKAP